MERFDKELPEGISSYYIHNGEKVSIKYNKDLDDSFKESIKYITSYIPEEVSHKVIELGLLDINTFYVNNLGWYYFKPDPDNLFYFGESCIIKHSFNFKHIKLFNVKKISKEEFLDALKTTESTSRYKTIINCINTLNL